MTGDRFRAIEFVGAFESTYMPRFDKDVAETTEHDVRFQADLALLEGCRVRTIRYPCRWHRVEAEAGRFDWRSTDRELGLLNDWGFRSIVDLVHHTSYPRWLTGGFGDPRFRRAYLRFVEAFANRFPATAAYTLFNEPFSTLFLAGHEAIWPPYHHGMPGLVGLMRNVVPAVAEASRMCRDLLPGADHVYTDTCERHSAGAPEGEDHTRMANDRRFFVLDLLVGSHIAPDRPFAKEVVDAGGEDLLSIAPGAVDVLGLDYYAHSQWHYVAGAGIAPSPAPAPLADVIGDYWVRYGLPCMLTETNVRGYPSDRATWLKYTLEQCELAAEHGIPITGYCWFPFVDSCDWDSMLFRCEARVDPVGVFWLDEGLDRRASCMSVSFALAAAGTPASQLPAYRLRRPVADWLNGYAPHMDHWVWQPPPALDICRNPPPVGERLELGIVLKH